MATADRADVVVLGLGGMGCAALDHLARRGARVLGLERFRVGHDRGSSHGQTRLIRQAYMEHEAYVPLLLRAYQLWDELGEDRGRPVLHRTGLLYLGPPGGEVLPSVQESARLHGLALEHPGAEEVAARYPWFRPAPGHAGLLESLGGYVESEDAIQAHVARARRHGAEIREETEVLGWEAAGEGVRVRTAAGDIEAGRLVVSAGAWNPGLFGALPGPPLAARRVPLFWFRPREPGSFRDLPCFLTELPTGYFYGFPELDPWGVKVAQHLPLQPVPDPSALDREVHEADLAPVRAAVEAVLPGLVPEPSHHAVCMYTMSADEHFVVDLHPEHPQVVLAGGFSGHGYKFASVMGEVLADLALEGATAHPVDFLGLGRF